MVSKKILIVGDSFSADSSDSSWTKNIGVEVDNLSTCGSSEYRILQKLETVDTSSYDKIIVVHTSANRIYVEQNPIHIDSVKYQNCDLIYNDIKNAPKSAFTQNVTWWFENCWSLQQAEYVHKLLIDRAILLTASKSLHLTFFQDDFPGVTCLHSYWKKYPGNINHLTAEGNQQVAKFIREKL